MSPLDNLAAETPCPSRKELVAFSSGDLPPPALESITEHVSRCPRCLSALGTVAEEGSSTLRELRRALQGPVADRFADDPEYRRMEVAAITRPPTGDTPRPRLSDASTPDLKPPFTLGQYQVVAKIGQGGMGLVYRALHPD
jgi:hypothetical protein